MKEKSTTVRGLKWKKKTNDKPEKKRIIGYIVKK